MEKGPQDIGELAGNPAVSAINMAISRFAVLISKLHNDLAESERSSTRLSRNIQKSLIYATEISTHDELHQTVRILFEGVKNHDRAGASASTYHLLTSITGN